MPAIAFRVYTPIRRCEKSFTRRRLLSIARNIYRCDTALPRMAALLAVDGALLGAQGKVVKARTRLAGWTGG